MTGLYRRLESRIQALPGVRAASFAMTTFNDGEWNSPVWPQGVAQTEANAKSFGGNRVGAQYFAALGTPVVSGRTFGPQDTPKSPAVVVVNETFARSLFPNGSALGRRFSLGGHDGYEIVGVVKDAKYEVFVKIPRDFSLFTMARSRIPMDSMTC
ncbi:MAG TPA: ABC transporter permease [Bryobacteraceae bacterium]|nr:ABC transporter permease [Bryobacteraceae bacterium]